MTVPYCATIHLQDATSREHSFGSQDLTTLDLEGRNLAQQHSADLSSTTTGERYEWRRNLAQHCSADYGINGRAAGMVTDSSSHPFSANAKFNIARAGGDRSSTTTCEPMSTITSMSVDSKCS